MDFSIRVKFPWCGDKPYNHLGNREKGDGIKTNLVEFDEPYRFNGKPPRDCDKCQFKEDCKDNVFNRRGLALCEAVLVSEVGINKVEVRE